MVDKPGDITFIADIDPPSYYIPSSLVNGLLCVYYWYNTMTDAWWQSAWWDNPDSSHMWCRKFIYIDPEFRHILQDIREIMNYA